MAWAERAMPVLAGLAERYSRERPFAGVRIAACLHVTAETGVFLRALRSGGAGVALCASNPLATSDDVAAALRQEGMAVFARSGADRGEYEGHIAAAVATAPHLIFDDGCDLVTALHEDRPDLLGGVRGGCEETTTGLSVLRRRAAGGALRFPMLAVNEIPTLRVVDNRHGTGQSTLDAVLRATNLLLAGRTVVVAGFGPCGRGVAARAAGMGASVIVTEVNPGRALEAALEGYRVLPMSRAAELGEVFLTATGSADVLRPEHFALMPDGALLGNVGHFDVEIDLPGLARAAVAPAVRIRPHLQEYRMADGRRLLLLTEGRLVNLAAGDGHPAAVMDVSFAAQALAAEWLLQREVPLPPGVHAVPAALDTDLAQRVLAAMGTSIDVPAG